MYQHISNTTFSPASRQTCPTTLNVPDGQSTTPTNCEPSPSSSLANTTILTPTPQRSIRTQRTNATTPARRFARGRIVKQWREHQHRYLQTIQSPRKADRRTQTLITGLWDIFFQMWLHRNEAFHSNKNIQDKLHKIHLIDQEIRQQWNIGPHDLNPADRIHFQNITLAQLLRKTRHYKQTWLQRVNSTRTAIHTEEEED